MKDYSIAYSEVYFVLEALGDTYKNKIPKRFVEFINENRKKDYIMEDITEENISDLSVSRDALVILSLLNLNYWEEDESEKARLLEIYKQNDEKKFGNYKEDDWLANSSKKIEGEEPKVEEKEEIEKKQPKLEDNKRKEDEFLIVVNENSIIYKVKKFIKKIINKWKKEK